MNYRQYQTTYYLISIENAFYQMVSLDTNTKVC